MSKRLGSSQQGKQHRGKKPPIPGALRREDARLAKIPDSETDLTDMPEQLDWSKAVMGKYYKVIKEPVSLRIDSDVLSWFREKGKGYQSRINAVLRNYFLKEIRPR